jgi:hypothetical protein
MGKAGGNWSSIGATFKRIIGSNCTENKRVCVIGTDCETAAVVSFVPLLAALRHRSRCNGYVFEIVPSCVPAEETTFRFVLFSIKICLISVDT